MRFCLILFLIFCQSGILLAQDSTAVSNPILLDSLPEVETIIDTSNLVLADKFKREKLWFVIPGESPGRAMAMAAAMPGLGHLYNGQKSRAIFWSGLMAGATGLSLYSHYRKPEWKSEAGTALAVVYGLNMLDAYVYSHVKREDMLHSPVKAAYLSALLPGLGQAYNGNSWKCPLVTAAIGSSLYGVFYFDYLHDKYKQLYIENDFDPTYVGQKDRHKRNKQLMIIVTSGLYLLNILDAFVDAHLHDFDVDEDLSLRPEVGVQPLNHSLYTGLRLSIPLH